MSINTLVNDPSVTFGDNYPLRIYSFGYSVMGVFVYTLILG